MLSKLQSSHCEAMFNGDVGAHERWKCRVSPSLDTPLYVTHDQTMRMAQYGISHDHAHDKVRVLQENEDVEFAGVYEPSTETIKQLGGHKAYKAVHWFSSKEEMLEDQSISAIAVTGEIFDNLDFAREVVEHGKHVWLDKPAGNDLAAFQEVLEIARRRQLNVQLRYPWRYHPGFGFILDWATSGRLDDIFSIRGRMSA